MDFFGLGTGEILLILVVIMILFGPRKIPEIARGLGKTMHAFRKASSEFSQAVTREIDEEKKALEIDKVTAKTEQNSAGTRPGETADPGANI